MALAALTAVLMTETLNPGFLLAAETGSILQAQSQNDGKGGNDSKKPKEPLLKFSGSGTLFVGTNGGINPVANARLNVRNVLEFNAIGDSGYLADPKTRRNNSELFLETHAYLFPKLPLRPVLETYNWTNKPDLARIGLGANVEIGNVAKFMVDYYFRTFPSTVEVDRLLGGEELLSKAVINIGNFSFDYMRKDINKKKTDNTSFWKGGAQYRFGKGNSKNKKNYIRAEYRDWPTTKDGPYQGRRQMGFYVGYGRRF